MNSNQNSNSETENNSEYNKFQKLNLDIDNLAKNYDKRLFHFVLRRIRNEEDARDIVQTTYMEAIKCAHNFRHESKPETWLMGIALNLTRNQLHKAYHRYEFNINNDEENEEWLENIAGSTAHPQDIIEQKQGIEAVLNGFNQMSKEMRDTAFMVLVNNVSYEKTAKEMKIPVGTVRSRVSRARQLLKSLQEDFSN
jgi:RNA polymerase sigma-70 factor (ECF subfamily)